MSAQRELNGHTAVPFPHICFPRRALDLLAAGSIKPVDTGILLAILKFRKNGGLTCWVKTETLSRITGMSNRHVHRSLHRLTDAGLIDRYICGRPDPMDSENKTGYRFNLLFNQSMVALRVPRASLPRASLPPASPKLDGRKKLDGRRIPEGGEAPPESTPSQVWDSRQQECIDLATQRWGACNGDYVVGDLLRTFTPEVVMAAIDRHWDKVGPSLRPALLRATCEGLFNDAKAKQESNGKPALNGNGHVAKTYGVIPGP